MRGVFERECRPASRHGDMDTSTTALEPRFQLPGLPMIERRGHCALLQGVR